MEGKLENDLDFDIKPTERHQYIHYSYSHPRHNKRSIVDSQTLRISKIISHLADFTKHILNCGFLNAVILMI